MTGRKRDSRKRGDGDGADRSTPSLAAGSEVSGAQSVRRATLLLRILASTPEARLSEISRSSGLSAPTTRRLLQVLIEDGLVEQSSTSRRYSIGPELAMLAMSRPYRPPILPTADVRLRRLARDVGDTTFLTIHDRYDSLCIGRFIGTYPIQVVTVDAGTRRPLGVSSAGLAILANLPTAKAEKILQHNELRFGTYGTDLKTASKRLEQARQLGYSINNVGLSIGTRTVSVPIAATDRTPAASLTVSGIHRRLTNNRIPDVIRLLREAAADIGGAFRVDR